MLPPQFKRWPLATFMLFRLDPGETYTFNNDGRNTSVASYLTAGSFISVVNTTTGDNFADSTWKDGEPSLWTRFETGRFEMQAGPDGAEWVCLSPVGKRLEIALATLPPGMTLAAGATAFVAKGWARTGGVTQSQLGCFVATAEDRLFTGSGVLLLATQR